MTRCEDETKYGCGEPEVRPTEVSYGNGSLPEWSGLTGEARCDTVDEAVRELYGETSSLKRKVDMSGLSVCMGTSGKGLTMKGAIEKIRDRYCELLERFAIVRGAYLKLRVCECAGEGDCY
jgi:hypothetical protein